MILTPEQIERLFADPRGPKTVPPMSEYIRILNTLAAYVGVVWNVAEMETATCPWCNAWLMSSSLLVSKVETDGLSEYVTSEIEECPAQPHASDCVYLQIRKLLGLEP